MMMKLTQYTKENDMYEVATGRPTEMVREDREPDPYVVRDLSWEFARYLDAEDSLASVSTTQQSVRKLHR
jgi:hypothetical protein